MINTNYISQKLPPYTEWKQTRWNKIHFDTRDRLCGPDLYTTWRNMMNKDSAV